MFKFIPFLLSAHLLGAVVDGEIIVTSLDGVGSYTIAGSSNELAKGSVIKSGSNVKTMDKSKTELFISNGIRLVVLPNSSLNIKTLKQEEGSFIKPNPEGKSVKESSASITDLEVESGKVVGDVKKLAPMSLFTMKTPVGTVNIKGTIFSVEYKKGEDGKDVFNVGCLVGRITVQMADPRISPVSVPAGKQMSVSSQPTAGGEKGGERGGLDFGTGAPPPPMQNPPMRIEIKDIPQVEIKEIAMRAGISPQQIQPKPPMEGPKESNLDKIIQGVENSINREQVNPSPTGG